MQRIILLVTVLGSAVALACSGAPLCVPLAPGDRLLVPANAPAFVAATSSSSEPGTLTVRLTGVADGGVRALEPLDASVREEFTLYAPGPLARGDLLTVESDVPTCASSLAPTAAVSVIDAAPFPSEVGTVVLGEPAGTLRGAGGIRGDCRPVRELPAVKRSVSVILPDAALPWLSVARVRVNGARADFGHLARSVTPGTPTLVGEVTSDCDVTRGVHQQALTIELEIAGRGEILRAESVVPMDCSVAPPAPAAGCTAVPGSALGLLALAFCLRRRF